MKHYLIDAATETAQVYDTNSELTQIIPLSADKMLPYLVKKLGPELVRVLLDAAMEDTHPKDLEYTYRTVINLGNVDRYYRVLEHARRRAKMSNTYYPRTVQRAVIGPWEDIDG